MKKIVLLILFLLLAVTLPSYAEFYRCTSDNGVTSYSEKPCSGQRSKKIDIEKSKPQSKQTTKSGLRPGEIKLLREIQQRRPRSTSTRYSRSGSSEDYSRKQKCQRIKNKLRVVEEQLGRPYTGGKGSYLEGKRYEYNREIRNSCR